MTLGPLEVRAVVSCPLWVLGTQLGPLEEQVTAKPYLFGLQSWLLQKQRADAFPEE